MRQVDRVPDFTYMYELYDPYAIILFHQSKPLVVDAGFGPVKKLTEIESVPWLRGMLVRAVRAALNVRLDASETVAAAQRDPMCDDTVVGDTVPADAPDAPASLSEEASRIAQGASVWLAESSESIGNRMGAAMERSGGWLQRAEERGWGVLERAGSTGLAALEGARQRIKKRVGAATPAGKDASSAQTAEGQTAKATPAD